MFVLLDELIFRIFPDKRADHTKSRQIMLCRNNERIRARD
jgi:hypothetical protein